MLLSLKQVCTVALKDQTTAAKENRNVLQIQKTNLLNELQKLTIQQEVFLETQ